MGGCPFFWGRWMLQWELIAGGHIGPGGRSARQRRAGRDGARPLQRWSRPMAAGCVTESAQRAARRGRRAVRRTGGRAAEVVGPYEGASQAVRSGRADVGIGPYGGSFPPFLCTLWKTSSGKGADRLLTGREKDAILKAYRRGWVWQPGAAGGNARRYAPLAAKECGCVQIQVEPRIVSIRPELFGSGRFSMPRRGKEGRCGDFSGSGRAFWRSPSA